MKKQALKYLKEVSGINGTAGNYKIKATEIVDLLVGFTEFLEAEKKASTDSKSKK